MTMSTPPTQERANVARHPIPFAFLLGTSFIGIWWLLDPLWVRLGWSQDSSRPHLIFVGAVYAVAMTIWMRRRANQHSDLAR
jgi:hypothetical protein